MCDPAKSPRRAELTREDDVVLADAGGGLVPLRALARSLAEAIASKLNWNSRCVRCDGPVATARTPTPAYALGAAAPARPEVGRRDLGRPSMDPRALEPRRGVSNDIGARRSADRVSEEALRDATQVANVFALAHLCEQAVVTKRSVGFF